MLRLLLMKFILAVEQHVTTTQLGEELSLLLIHFADIKSVVVL